MVDKIIFILAIDFNMLCKNWNYAQHVRKESLEQQEKLVLEMKVSLHLENLVVLENWYAIIVVKNVPMQVLMNTYKN